MSSARHPFAQYPYQPWQAPPGYVGPAWGAPGPYVALPPRKKSGCVSGCTVAFLLLVAGVVICAGAFVIIAAIVAGNTPPTSKADPPPPQGADPEVWQRGVCRDSSTERDKPVYEPALSSGSARRLRGKVGMLHVRLQPHSGGTWTRDAELRVEQAALLAQRFYLHHAARYGVHDLAFDVLPWKLDTPVTMPPLVLESNNRLDDATVHRLRVETRRAIEMAMSERLETLVERMRRDGYEEVGLTVYFPVTTRARAFAWFALRSDSKSFPEVAYMFSPLRDFGELAVTVAHEGLHLFGADDLYRTKIADPADQHDIMAEYCTGFREATIGDATAYAIGWRATPPPRKYGFKPR